MAENYSDIINSIDITAPYKSVTDRYFEKRYCINVKNVIGNDHMLLFHSNKICIITLAPSHPLFKKEEGFVIDYTVGNTDRTKNTVSGKGKKGGQVLDTNSTLCKIKCNDGEEFVVSSCIKGRLMEVNEVLVDKPSLLKSDPDSCGYIAVVLSQIAISEARKEELLTKDEYETALELRKKC